MICKNCKHPIIETNKGWVHLDKHRQPVSICLRPVFSSPIPEACRCQNAEPREIKEMSKTREHIFYNLVEVKE